MAEEGSEDQRTDARSNLPVVFISYASADKATADAVCVALETAGIPCWIAPRDVKPGALYADAIVRAITNAKALILVLSENSIVSSHVGKEIERASSKKRPIIALRIDNAPLTPALEYFLSESQWVEAQAENKASAHARLIDAIREPEGAAPGIHPAVTPYAGTAPAAQPKERQNRILVAAVLVVVAVALAGLLAVKFRPAKHVAVDQQMTAATGVLSDKSIAVLPFTDMSEKHDQEYFGDGMAEEILDLLVKIPGLTIIGRTSSFQFKGKNEDLRSIGTQLNAAYVLEGSVRKSGDQVRTTAQLINTQTGTHRWSETYDRHSGDVLQLQDAIAAAVVRELQLRIAPGILNSRSTLKSTEAYELTLRGRYAADRFDRDGLEQSITLFQQALDRDPTYADAAALLAETYQSQAGLGHVPPAVGYEQARRAAALALRLDANNALAHVEMARILNRYDWDWTGAQEQIQQAAKLAPGAADVIAMQAEISSTLGHWDDALGQISAALAQDPLSLNNLNILSNIQEARGNLRAAEALRRRAVDIRPDSSAVHANLGAVLLAQGNLDGALREMQAETLDEGKQQGLALVYYALRRKPEADAALANLLHGNADDNALDIAEVYAFRGQSNEAMTWLERAYVSRDPYLYQIKGDSLLKSLVPDPRFNALLGKMNLPK